MEIERFEDLDIWQTGNFEDNEKIFTLLVVKVSSCAISGFTIKFSERLSQLCQTSPKALKGNQ